MSIINVLVAWYAQGSNLTSCSRTYPVIDEDTCLQAEGKSSVLKKSILSMRGQITWYCRGIKARDRNHSLHRKRIENVPEAHNNANWEYSQAEMADL